MYRLHTKLTTLLLLMAVCLLSACSQDSYEKGADLEPNEAADFVEAHSNAHKLIDYFLTDKGERINTTPTAYSWVHTPDTFYRAIIDYYQTGQAITVKSCKQVNIARIMPADSVKSGVKTDPVKMESVWLSQSLRYLNASIYLKVGSTADNSIKHRLAVVSDGTHLHLNGKRTLMLRLYHDQGGMPEYYSERIYFSVPLENVEADSICLSINTYTGTVSKTFALGSH